MSGSLESAGGAVPEAVDGDVAPLVIPERPPLPQVPAVQAETTPDAPDPVTPVPSIEPFPVPAAPPLPEGSPQRAADPVAPAPVAAADVVDASADEVGPPLTRADLARAAGEDADGVPREYLDTAALEAAAIGPAPNTQWAPPRPAPPRRGLSAWALAGSIIALLVSFVVGWGFPLGIVAIVAAILALRRPTESRAFAVWAIVLGAVSLAYSALWLYWAADQLGWLA